MAEGTVTVNGIEAPYDSAKLGDVRFVLMLGELSDDSLADSEKLSAYAHMVRFLFGDERYRILEGLAEANGGSADVDAFSTWLAEYFEAVGAKN